MRKKSQKSTSLLMSLIKDYKRENKIMTKKHLASCVIAISAGLLVVGLIFYSPSTPANPTITWTPRQATEIVSAGRSTTISATFVASENASDVTVRVVSELVPYVSINPPDFGTIIGGQPYSIDITFSPQIFAENGTYDGTIQLRNGAANLAKPLPVILTVVDGLPPDPGEAGKATLEGIDSDGNGVRDDIDRYIVFTYPDSAKKRMALTLYAKEEQKLLLDYLALQGNPTNQKQATRANAVERGKARECLLYTLGNATENDLRKAITVRRKLTAKFLNTQDRQQVYLDADLLLAGTVGGDRGDDRVLCQEFGFNPDTLSN